MHTEAETVTQLFRTDAHNPSFASIRRSLPAKKGPVDFCVPVNRHFPPASLLESIRMALPDIVKYYPDYAMVHQQALSVFTGIPDENLVVANGSTELITLLCQQARGPFSADVPTFGRWTDLPLQQGLPSNFLHRQEEQGFALDVATIISHVRQHGIRTLVLCNPNNPTGAALRLDEIQQLVDELCELDRIIIDESFIDFSDVVSATEIALQTPRLIVIKSLGKSLGWHGLRLGYAVAETGTAVQLRAQVPYWNINGLAAFVLSQVSGMRDEFDHSLLRVRQDRQYMTQGLTSIDALRVFPSQANFVFVRLPDGLSGCELRDDLLADHGLMIRECSNKLACTEQYLRLAVNRQDETDLLVNAMRSLLSSEKSEAARESCSG